MIHGLDVIFVALINKIRSLTTSITLVSSLDLTVYSHLTLFHTGKKVLLIWLIHNLLFFLCSVWTQHYILNHISVLFAFQQGVWETLLAALEILIRANHHQQMFNVKQLLKAQVVHHFLLTCQVLQVLPVWSYFVLGKY